mgnify:FL=1
MSEAELHLIRARLIGGMINKAQRGELKMRLPVGFVYDINDRVQLDPDKRVRESITLLFNTFQRTGTAGMTLREFRQNKILFPKQIFSGPRKGEIVFSEMTYSRVFQILRNPRYAGAFVYGRRYQIPRGLENRSYVKFASRDKWQAFIKNAHSAYISWDDHEEILKRLLDNSTQTGKINYAPREGPALLQGIAICGICGNKMSVRYHARPGRSLSPDYSCKGIQRKFERLHCQSMLGDGIDKKIGEIIVEAMTPASLEVALSVQLEMRTRVEESDRLRYRHVEKAQYELDLAKRRFMSVDPANRLVADELESEWNKKIREFREAKNDYDAKHQAEILVVSEEQRQKVLNLATDFPKLWADPKTEDRERKRMIRLLIEDVTLLKGPTDITMHIRYKGGATRSVILPRPKTSWEDKKHSPNVIAEIDQLLRHHTDAKVAEILNKKNFTSGTGKSFCNRRVAVIRRAYGLSSHCCRLRKKGLMTTGEICKKYNIDRGTVARLRESGKLAHAKYDDAGRYLYYDPNCKSFFNKSCKTQAGKKTKCHIKNKEGAI